ncbi:MAG: RNA polymerase sigma factor [Actinobacteria bacterium]|nr:RNA polymerase sigma factor [Actinomycetota bacterium]
MVDDEVLLSRCRRGDERAWGTLVARYERLVHAIPLNLGLSPDDAADVTQASFAALLRAVDTIETPGRISAWLSTVAKRESIRIIERRARERSLGERTQGDVFSGDSGTGAIDSGTADVAADDDRVHQLAADVEWVHQGLQLVSSRCREVLTTLYFSGITYEEAATRLGMPIGSLGPTRGRCLDRLRAVLATTYDADR